MFSSKTYVVAWDELMHNSLDIDSQLGASELEYLVFDVSTEPVVRPNWIIAEKVRYFGHFYNSLVDFSKTDHEIFIFNAGDASCTDHAGFTNRVEQMMSKDDSIWMMASNMINDGGTGVVTMIQMSRKYPNHSLAIHLNGIWVALKRELALFILDYYEWLLKRGLMDFSKMISGHCLDTVYAAWTLYNNKKIYRDWSFTMTTGTTTSHNGATSVSDCSSIKGNFLKYVHELGYEAQVVSDIYMAIDEKTYHYTNQAYPIEKAYPNLENVSGFEF